MKKSGISLIEIIIVVGVLAGLVGVVFVSVDPATRLAQSRDVRRMTDLEAIGEALQRYKFENEGVYPSSLGTDFQMLGTASVGCEEVCGDPLLVGEGGSGGGTFLDSTEQDFNAGIYTDTQWNASDSVLEISSSGGGGSFRSRIFDAGESVAWNLFAWESLRPVGRPLPAGGASETAYTIGNANMSDNILLLPMDESSGTIEDISGQGHSFSPQGNVGYGATGKFNRALYFDGSGDHLRDTDGADYINGASAITVSVWVQSHELNTDNGIFFTDSPSGDDDVLGLRYDAGGFYGGELSVIKGSIYTTSGGEYQFETDPWVQSTSWKHLVFVWESGQSVRFYINGSLVGFSYEDPPVGGTITDSTTFLIGKGSKDGGNSGWNGFMDEFSVWQRALSFSEVQDLFRRGTYRIEAQVRSCADAMCTGENFIGPDGTSGTFFRSSDFSGSGQPSFLLPYVADNRYFQYEMNLQSDLLSSGPQVKRVRAQNDETGGSYVATQTSSACLDLSGDLLTYLPQIPIDPREGSPEKTGYALYKNPSGGFLLRACHPERRPFIEKRD